MLTWKGDNLRDPTLNKELQGTNDWRERERERERENERELLPPRIEPLVGDPSQP